MNNVKNVMQNVQHAIISQVVLAVQTKIAKLQIIANVTLTNQLAAIQIVFNARIQFVKIVKGIENFKIKFVINIIWWIFISNIIG